MKVISALALGVLTAVGGFVDVGNIATAGAAGSKFGYSLIWAIALGTVVVIFLIEMVGRMAAMGDKGYADIVREKFGFKFAIVPFSADVIANVLLLSAEIGGAGFALYLLTDISFRIWAVAVALALIALLLNASFGVIENTPSVLGLVTLCFVVAAFTLGTPWKHAGQEALLPRIDSSGGPLEYFFIATAIIGSVSSPYLLSFYSSGAREDHWSREMVGTNRFVAVAGMTFGAVSTLAILIVSAVALQSRGIEVDQLQTVGLGLVDAFGRWGVYLFAATLFICCFGAAIEVSLTMSFELTQMMGWRYGVDEDPSDAPIFTLVYVVMILICTAFIAATGFDPLQITLYSMVVIALILPFDVIPFLIIMNDPIYLKDQTNHRFANAAVLAIIAVAFVMSIVVLPLTLMSGGQ